MNLLEQKIEEAGHRVKIRPLARRNLVNIHTRRQENLPFPPVILNVSRDKKGEYFDFQIRPDVKPSVIDIEGDHLLLMFKAPEKSKFLIGHDERQLFVAAIPEDRTVTSVKTAKDALKPKEVLEFEKGKVKHRDRHKRNIGGRKRQGDFFFIPAGTKEISAIPNFTVHKNEPIARGTGSQHICSELIRIGGEVRYFLISTFNIYNQEKFEFDYPNGCTISDCQKIEKKIGRRLLWTTRLVGNITVYVKGRVRHPEHKTLVLNRWHKVIPNTETTAKAMQHLAFVD